MKAKIEMGARYLLALMMAVFGANKFFSFLPMPDPPKEGGEFLGALANAGYVFPTLGGLYLLSAVLLFANRAVGLALVLLAPLAVNTVLYHVRFDPDGIGAALLFGGLVMVTALAKLERFESLWKR